jgi:hypothetical protein
MSMPRLLPALLLLVAGTACGAGGSDSASPSSAAAPSPTAARPASADAASVPGTRPEYQQALAQHACYANSFDAANDPLGLDVACTDSKAGFRLAGIQPAASGDCPSSQILVSAKQASADAVAPSLCLETVTH